jgi:haloacetate dehalogenase
VIAADPDAWYCGDPAAMGDANHAEWRAAMRKPDVVRGMLEDDRAGLTVKYADEAADRAADRHVTQPLQVL